MQRVLQHLYDEYLQPVLMYKTYLFTEDNFDFVGTLEYALSILEIETKH